MSPARSEARSGPHTTGFIDIGANSLRLMVVRLEPDRSWSTITLQKEPVRLGEDEFGAESALQPEAMDREGARAVGAATPRPCAARGRLGRPTPRSDLGDHRGQLAAEAAAGDRRPHVGEGQDQPLHLLLARGQIVRRPRRHDDLDGTGKVVAAVAPRAPGEVVAQHAAGDHRVLQVAEMVLEVLDLLDERPGAGPEHVLEELERVAQPLAALAQRVEARQRRLEAAELPLEGPHDRHVLVEGPGQDLGDTLRTKVGRRARREALERPVQQLREALDEGAVAPAVEIVDEVLALTFALRAARREQAVEIAGALGRQGVEVVLRLLLEDVEVAHRAQRASRTPQALSLIHISEPTR